MRNYKFELRTSEDRVLVSNGYGARRIQEYMSIEVSFTQHTCPHSKLYKVCILVSVNHFTANMPSIAQRHVIVLRLQ